jgi:hypothetical protein
MPEYNPLILLKFKKRRGQSNQAICPASMAICPIGNKTIDPLTTKRFDRNFDITQKCS